MEQRIRTIIATVIGCLIIWALLISNGKKTEKTNEKGKKTTEYEGNDLKNAIKNDLTEALKKTIKRNAQMGKDSTKTDTLTP